MSGDESLTQQNALVESGRSLEASQIIHAEGSPSDTARPLDDRLEAQITAISLTADVTRPPHIWEAEANEAPNSDAAAGESHDTTRKVVRGTASMLLREGLLKVVVLAAGIVLARILAPRDFGIFVILGFFNSLLATFGAVGLGPSIVQRPRELSEGELRALFTVQVLMAGVLVVAVELGAPLAAEAYHLGTGGAWLIRIMALSFLAISAAATPMALLERRVAFGRVALVDVTTGVLYQLLAVAMAIAGFGVWSLVVATLVSNAAGAVVAFLCAGWWPRFSLRWRPILPMIRFGLQYQANNVIAFFKDNIAATFVAAMVGAAAVGYISWANMLATYPLVFMGIVARIGFPVFAQANRSGDTARLRRVIEATMRVQSYAIFPAVAAIGALAPSIIHLIFSDKWIPALPLLYFMLTATLSAGVSTGLVSALNAIGKPAIVTRLMIMWLVLDWGVTVPLVLWLGTVGFAVANACVSVTVLVTVYTFKHFQPIQIWRNIGVPLLSAAIGGGAIFVLSSIMHPTSVAALVLQGGGVLAVFLTCEALFDRHFLYDTRLIVRAIRTRVATPSPHIGDSVGAAISE